MPRRLGAAFGEKASEADADGDGVPDFCDDGTDEHPTQALLDAFTIRRRKALA